VTRSRTKGRLVWLAAALLLGAARLRGAEPPAPEAPTAEAPAPEASAAEAPAAPPFTLAEARLIDAVRTHRADNDIPALVNAARAYLVKYPQGRYADEALLALGDGLAASHKTAEAQAAYQKLIDEHPDSALRDEARLATLPLLQEQGKGEAAEALAWRLGDSASPQRDEARLWLARRLFDAHHYARASGVLDTILPGNDLSPAQQTELVRLEGLSLWNEKQREPAKRWLLQYLARDDAPEAKADILMLLAADANGAGRSEEALGYYQQVIDRYPVAPCLPQALYDRADLYDAQIKNDPQGELGRARARQAIAYFSAYLDTHDEQYRAPALRERVRLLAAAGRNEEALQDYEALAAMGEPYRSDVDLLRGRVAVLKKLHREDEAAALLDAAVRGSSLAPQVRLSLLMDQAELEYARKNCPAVESLLQPMPLFSDIDLRRRALFMRGFCRYQRGQWEAASVDLESFIDNPEYEPLVVTALLDSYEKSAQYPRLTRTAEDLLITHRIEPSESLLLQMGRAYAHLGEAQKIVDAYARLEQLNPKALQTPSVQLALGIAYDALGQVDAAVARYKSVLALAAGPPPAKEYMDALERLQPLYLRLNRYAELELLDQKAAALAKDPAQQKRIQGWRAQAELAWGQSLVGKGQKDKSIAHLNKARALTKPGDGDLRVEVIVALAQAYSGKDASAQATRLVKGELAASKAPAQKARLVSALVATSADWGARLAKGGDLDGAIEYYVQTLKRLGGAQPQDRYALAMRLDPLYAAKGNYAARLQLADRLSADPALASMRGDLVLYRSEVLKGWGRSDARHGSYKSAIEKYGQALTVLPATEWRRRYETAAAIGQLAGAHQDYGEIVAAYEKVMPGIADPALQAQVRQYIGRVDLEWAAQSRAKKDLRTARRRFAHALELLPAEPPADRLAAMQGLSQVLIASGQPQGAAKMLAAEYNKSTQREAQQSAALMLGELYRSNLHDDEQARTWFAKADAGDTAETSLAAGLALAELDESGGHAQAAIQRLQALAARNLDRSPWFVPIHYKLAVIYHGQQKLSEALDEYTRAAQANGREAVKRYAKIIAESREQARAISEYLKLTGGAAGSRIAVPKLRESR